MARDERTATLSAVAQSAGVSLSTASKALNGRGDVAPKTRARVLEAAIALNYETPSVASPIDARPTRRVALVTHDRRGRFSFPVLAGVEDELDALRATVVLCQTRGDAIREQHCVRSLVEDGIDGIIVFDESANPRPSIGRLQIPVVYAYAPSQNADDCSIGTDDRTGGRLAARHLVDLGRTHVAIVAGDVSYTAASDRVDGATEALNEAGREIVGGQGIYGSWTENWGWAATSRLLMEYPDIDALICGSDQIARGAYDALNAAFRTIPGDVAVVGYDNWEAMVAGMRPPLTSVDPNLDLIGRTAAKRLREAWTGHPIGGMERVPPKLVVRPSSGT